MQELVQKYYGEILGRSEDLKTDACSTPDAPPAHIATILKEIHPEVSARYYGCGLVLPEALQECRVLDLGCGSGRDCFLLSRLVGPTGHVVGVDMTEAQLDVAKRHRDYHRDKFGYSTSNVRFLHGFIEKLDALPLEPRSFDVVVSNCVINLCEDKAAVLAGAYRLLKDGGELYFADVYADRRVPDAIAKDPVLYGECLGGALYWNDFIGIAKAAGFLDPRLVADRPIAVTEPRIAELAGDIRFFSATYRLFKLPGLESSCEDYSQKVTYNGTIPHHADRFVLDKHHDMATGEPFPVCGNTFDMLHETRFRTHFEFHGDRYTHRGIFPGCGTSLPFAEDGAVSGSCC